jgi:hypothetical protein
VRLPDPRLRRRRDTRSAGRSGASDLPAEGADAQRISDPRGVEAKPRTGTVAEPERAEPLRVLAHPLRGDAEATRDLRRGQQPLLLVRPAVLREPSGDALRDEVGEDVEVVRMETRIAHGRASPSSDESAGSSSASNASMIRAISASSSAARASASASSGIGPGR